MTVIIKYSKQNQRVITNVCDVECDGDTVFVLQQCGKRRYLYTYENVPKFTVQS